MHKSKLNSLIKKIEDLLVEMTEKDIIDLSKNDNGVFNVIRGLHKESFSTILWNDEIDNFEYYIIYTTNVNNKLEGFVIKLQPLIKNRNELTNIFSNFISKKFNKNQKKTIGVFNAFQSQQRTLFKKKGYLTFGDELKKEYGNKNASLLVKGNKIPLFVPYANEEILIEKKKILTEEKNKLNYVYIMLNNLNGYYKIGRSIKPEHRERTLQSQEPDVVLIDKWVASAEVEKNLHIKYKEKRIRGEWFELGENDIEEIKTFMLTIKKKRK